MKRDSNLVRAILLAVESQPDPYGFGDFVVEGREPLEVSYHVKLMRDAGLLEALDLSTRQGMDWRPTRLTWEGHELLDKIRSEFIWDEVLRDVRERGLVSASIDVLKGLADKAIRKRLE